MNLLEVLTGSLVFAAAAGASLQIWALAATATQDQERRQRRLEAADLSLLRAEAAQRRLAVSGESASAGDCAAATQRLIQALTSEPLAAGVERQLRPAAGGDGAVLRLVVEGVAEPRERLFLPAALGLCGTPAPAGAATVEPAQPPAPWQG